MEGSVSISHVSRVLTDDLVVDVDHWKVADPPVGGDRGGVRAHCREPPSTGLVR